MKEFVRQVRQAWTPGPKQLEHGVVQSEQEVGVSW